MKIREGRGDELERRLALTLVCCCVLASSTSARADEASLSWVRLDGAETCIAAPELARLVEARIGRAVLQPPTRADLSLEARVAPHRAGGWVAVVDVNDRAGRRLGRRELRVAAGSCSELDRPASLIISLIIDPNAAGPGLLQRGSLSPDAQRLLTQLDLPSADPDELLASLSFTPRPLARSSPSPAPHPGTGSTNSQPAKVGREAPPAKMVSVPEAEWRRLRSFAHAEEPRDSAGGLTPAWPGYALLGLGAAAVGATVYAVVRVDELETDPGLLEYRRAVNVESTNACVDAREGLTYGLSPNKVQHVADVCDEGQLMEVLLWVFAGTAVASSLTGGAWLLWIADDDSAKATDDPSRAALSLSPFSAASFNGVQLRLQL